MTLRENKTAAYCLPFLAFMLFMPLVGWIKVNNPLLPWWRQGPEHWIYPLQTVVCLALLAFWWRQYEFRPLTARVVCLAVVAGVIGMVLWVLPSVIFQRTGYENQWLGMVSRAGPGFDPTILQHSPAGYWSSLVLRFIRMTFAVAFVEELMMRGFIWRYLVDPNGDFWKVPFGIWHKLGVGGSILAFTVGHHVPDLLGCVIYGIIISWLAIRTKSLGACVICHGVTNFILGLYIMQTGQWGFW